MATVIECGFLNGIPFNLQQRFCRFSIEKVLFGFEFAFIFLLLDFCGGIINLLSFLKTQIESEFTNKSYGVIITRKWFSSSSPCYVSLSIYFKLWVRNERLLSDSYYQMLLYYDFDDGATKRRSIVRRWLRRSETRSPWHCRTNKWNKFNLWSRIESLVFIHRHTLLRFLENLKWLIKWTISTNNIGEDGATFISEGLSELTSLRSAKINLRYFYLRNINRYYY